MQIVTLLCRQKVHYHTHAVKATFGSDVAVEGFASHWIFYEMPTITYKNERNVVLEYPFEITDQLIDSVKITGLTAPVAGKQPQTSGFKASDSSLNLEIDWSDSSNKFATDGSFIGGNTYKALISVYADTSTNDIVELDTSKISVNTGSVSAGPYPDTFYVTFTAKKLMSNATVTVADQAWTGSALTPAPTVKYGSTTLKKDTDYTVSYKNNTNLGTATVTITGKGNYTGTKTATFKITQRSITPTITLTSTAYTYDGKGKTPGVTVKDGSKTLVKNTDYTVAYKKNTDVGKAVVVITGKGNYKGTAKATFKIKQDAQPLEVTKTTKSVKYTKVKKETQKVKGAITVTGAVGTVQYKKVSGDDCLTIVKSSGAIEVKKGTAKGTYKIKVKVVALATDNYKKTAKTVTVKIKVK